MGDTSNPNPLHHRRTCQYTHSVININSLNLSTSADKCKHLSGLKDRFYHLCNQEEISISNPIFYLRKHNILCHQFTNQPWLPKTDKLRLQSLSSNRKKICTWRDHYEHYQECHKVQTTVSNLKTCVRHDVLQLILESRLLHKRLLNTDVKTGEPYPCQMQKNQTFSCLFRHYAKHNGLKKEGTTANLLFFVSLPLRSILVKVTEECVEKVTEFLIQQFNTSCPAKVVFQ